MFFCEMKCEKNYEIESSDSSHSPFFLNNEGNSNYIQTIPAGQNGSFIRLIEHEDDASEV